MTTFSAPVTAIEDEQDKTCAAVGARREGATGDCHRPGASSTEAGTA
ncbi:hypothetical protein [Halomonas sp. KO116]|nr:hypothetical protein [Halomonas sp. KO116]